MKRLRQRRVAAFAVGLGGFLLSGAAIADGYQSQAHQFYPPYSWSGLYIGANVGGARADSVWTNTASSAASATFPDLLAGDRTSQSTSGWIGGGHIGLNHQSGNLVFGLEVSYSGTGLTGKSVSGPGLFSQQDDNFTTKIQSLVLLTGRIGAAWDRALIYGKGGFAWADVKTSIVDTSGPLQGSGSDSARFYGWTVGTGLEYALSNNLIIGAEYDYIRLGSESQRLGGTTALYNWDVNLNNIHELTARLSYKFGEDLTSASWHARNGR